MPKISALTGGTALATDEVPVNQGGESKKVTAGGIADLKTWDTLTGKPSTFPPETHNHDSDYAALVHSHAYGDLTDLPTLGDAAALDVGTSAGTVAAGDHTHAGGGDPLDAWPVGAVYISVVSTSPATLLGGGTWEAFGAGRMPVFLDAQDTDFDTAEATGGAKTSTALLAHVHGQLAPTSASSGALKYAIDTNASGSQASGLSTASAGSGASFSLMNPHIVVYAWKRTA